MDTTTQFPVDTGAVVKVTCSNSDAVNEGSREVTCKTGKLYTFLEEPSCLISGQLKNNVGGGGGGGKLGSNNKKDKGHLTIFPTE